MSFKIAEILGNTSASAPENGLMTSPSYGLTKPTSTFLLGSDIYDKHHLKGVEKSKNIGHFMTLCPCTLKQPP